MKIGVVIQRYGREVVGGSESLCREVCRRLARRGLEITVFTTRARDYITWANEYPAGETILEGVRVRRFSTEEQRDIKAFNAFSEAFFAAGENSEPVQREWIRKQGPYCPALLEGLRRADREVDLFLFFTYLYYPVVEGIRVVQKPVFLYPTAHDEPPVYLPVIRPVFTRPRALFFLTGAERRFVERTFPLPGSRLILVRTGLDIDPAVPKNLLGEKVRLSRPYMFYAGRIERGKGLETVFSGRDRWGNGGLDLVLVGKKLMDIPDSPRIRYLGFVTDLEKLSGFRDALFSLQPSPLESLSITTLESWSQFTPVLANGRCEVLREHVRQSGGGWLYHDAPDFARKALRLSRRRRLQKRMGKRGYRYVRNCYSWERVLKILIRHFREAAG